MRLFAHLRALDGPLRLPDLGEYVRTLGLAPGLIACRTFQGTPMRHRGLDVGHFFLGEKACGGEFTDEDEEVLVLLAAQAVIAIANARAHREERRTSRSATHVQSGVRLYPEMQSAHACITGRRFSSRSSRA